MIIYPSVKINGTDMYKKYKLVLADRHSVQPPGPKTYLVEVPGADGTVDLTDAMGPVKFNNREITLNFGRMCEIEKWPSFLSEIYGLYNGQAVELIFDDDENFFYKGRASFSDYERARRSGTFTVTVDADPYKYEVQDSTSECWPWDTFSFIDGIIREYGNIHVEGEYRMNIYGRRKETVPVIYCDSPMSVEFEGKIYELSEGRNKIYDIIIKQGDNILVFKGNGTVNVEYRGAML